MRFGAAVVGESPGYNQVALFARACNGDVLGVQRRVSRTANAAS